VHCLECTVRSCCRAIECLSDLPLLLITLGGLAATTGGLTFFLLIAQLPNLVAAFLVFVVLVLAALASAKREYGVTHS
jgi:hypothetical protein